MLPPPDKIGRHPSARLVVGTPFDGSRKRYANPLFGFARALHHAGAALFIGRGIASFGSIPIEGCTVVSTLSAKARRTAPRNAREPTEETFCYRTIMYA